MSFPFLVLLFKVFSSQWWPVSDWAIQFLRTQDVFSAQSPQLGPWSRWGWSHPGPAIFYLLAPFIKIFGARGMLIGPLFVNWFSCVASVSLMRKTFGKTAGVISTALFFILMSSLGSQFIMSAWNPSLAFFPFVFLLVMMWCLAQGQIHLLPIIGLVSTFCIQSHIGFTPLVIGSLGAVFMLLISSLVTKAEISTNGKALGRSLLFSGIVVIPLWVPPLIEEIQNEPGNVVQILRYAVNPSEMTVGWRRALTIMGTELQVWAPWSGRIETNSVGEVASRSPIQAVVVLAVLLYLVATRKRNRDSYVLSGGVLALGSVAAAFVATSRVSGNPYPYLVRWWWGVSVFLFLVVSISLVSRWNELVRRRIHRIVNPICVIAVTLVSISFGTNSLLEASYSRAALELGSRITPELSTLQRYLFVARDTRAFGAMGPALVSYLENHGFNVTVPNLGLDLIKYGQHRMGDPSQSQSQIELLGYEEIAAGAKPSDGLTKIVQWDALTANERNRLITLQDVLRSQLGAQDLSVLSDRTQAESAGISSANLDEYEGLLEKAFGYVVFLKQPPQ